MCKITPLKIGDYLHTLPSYKSKPYSSEGRRGGVKYGKPSVDRQKKMGLKNIRTRPLNEEIIEYLNYPTIIFFIINFYLDVYYTHF